MYYGRRQSSFYKSKGINKRAIEKSGDKRGNIRHNNKAIIRKRGKREMIAWIIVSILLFCVIVLYQYIQYIQKRILKNPQKRVETPQKYIKKRELQGVNQNPQKKIPDTAFIATFEDVGMDSIESQLNKMFSKADREIIIVSPWIKRGAWSRIETKVHNFINNGGTLKVFTKGGKEDFLEGFSDREVINAIKNLGGEVVFVPKLHAKIVVIDRQEAIITSANFTIGGYDFNYEAGIWTCNPIVVNKICWFIDELRFHRKLTSFMHVKE